MTANHEDANEAGAGIVYQGLYGAEIVQGRLQFFTTWLYRIAVNKTIIISSNNGGTSTTSA